MTTALPYDAGATLPLVQRYTDFRFRAVSRGGFTRALVERQLEAVALLRLLPINYARHVFMWSDRMVARVEGQAEEWAESKTVAAMHDANLRALEPGHAVALVKAMREGGWVKGHTEKLPEVVKLAMRAFRGEGLTIGQIADLFELPYWTVSYAFRVPHEQRMAKRRVGLVL